METQNKGEAPKRKRKAEEESKEEAAEIRQDTGDDECVQSLSEYFESLLRKIITQKSR